MCTYIPTYPSTNINSHPSPHFIYIFDSTLPCIAHGGIGPFTTVRFLLLWFINMSINKTGCGYQEQYHFREINAF